MPRSTGWPSAEVRNLRSPAIFAWRGDQAQMGLPEIMLGIIRRWGNPAVARLLGPARALEYMLTAKFIDMKEGNGRAGDRVVPPRGFSLKRQKWREVSHRGAACRPGDRGGGNGRGEAPDNEGLALESELIGKLASTEDKKKHTRFPRKAQTGV